MKKIIVHVRAGMVSSVIIPDGEKIEVYIHDYDVQEITDGLLKDKHGIYYNLTIWKN